LNTDRSIFPLTHLARNRHPERSEAAASALAFLSVIPEENLLLASALALAFLSVIPEGNLLLHLPLKPQN
jgi:hypothetical protein